MVIENLQPASTQKGDHAHLSNGRLCFFLVNQQDSIKEQSKQNQKDQVSPHVKNSPFIQMLCPISKERGDGTPCICITNVIDSEKGWDRSRRTTINPAWKGSPPFFDLSTHRRGGSEGELVPNHVHPKPAECHTIKSDPIPNPLDPVSAKMSQGGFMFGGAMFKCAKT